MDNPTEKNKLNAMSSFCQGQEYVERYHVFLEKCQQNERVVERLESCLPLTLHNHTDVVKVLSVGSGDGKVDLEILKIIKEASQKKIHCRVIEPNESHWKEYKKSLEDWPQNVDLTFDISEPKDFQSYMSDAMIERGLFNVVHFIHSIYYIDFEEALTHCYEKELGENGIILCVLGADVIMLEIKQKIFGISQPSQSIAQVVKKYGWKYQEYKDEYLVDVTEIMDDHSVTGNLLLDFLTHTVNFRDRAKKQKVKETLDLIHDLSIRKDGKMFSRKTDYYIFIFK